jgi:enterochelin esterase family protein
LKAETKVKQLLAIFIVTLLASSTVAQEKKAYNFGPDSMIQNVPQGEIIQGEILKSKTFPGTVRRYSVYVPKQYDAEKPAALMVFQDGHAYENRTGSYRATTVMDNLIARGEMPVTIGVFVDPGHKKDALPEKRGWRPQPENRANEYDTLSDAYATFLLDEVLPPVLEKYNVDPNPERWAICGASSGGICAFTVAWQRPDKFRKVLSHIGSFVNIRHGDTYPGIIRKTPKKPIRVFLQDGSADLDNEHGNWPLANQQMAKALAFKNYDYKFVYGTEAHNGIHGGAILPDSMRWLWRGDKDAKAAPKSITPEIQTAEWAVDWWMPRHEEKLIEKQEMEQVDLLFVGDSITHNWEKAGKAVFRKYYRKRNTLNIGFSGDRTEQVLWRFQNGAIDDIKPKLAVLMIGTNNTGHRMDPADETALGVKFILSELKNRLPETKILLLGIFPRDADTKGKHRILNDEINAKIKTFADDKNVFFLDVSDKFLDDEGGLSKKIMPDLLHPNAKGYNIWAKAMEPTIKKLMGE